MIRECGPGWNGLIDRTLARLSDTVEVVQIKEKFGELRIYFFGGTDTDDKIVCEAEDESATICEACGAPGKTRCSHGWYTTMCVECWEKHINEPIQQHQ